VGTLIGIAAIVGLVLLIRWMVKGVNPPSQTDIAKASAKGHSKVFLFKKKPFGKKGKACGGATNTQRYFLNLELITIKHSPNKTAKGVII